MTLTRTTSLVFMLFMCSAVSISADDICYDKAYNELFTMKSWNDLQSWHKDYPVCDDGFLGEGISEFVTASLAEHWETLADIQGRINNSPEFKVFILKHIDASADENNLMIIDRNARTKCLSIHKALCSEIEQRAQIALKKLN